MTVPNLECKDLVKRYGSHNALDGVNITAEPGRVLGLLGPNGAGKTTLIKLICGLLQPTSGEVKVCGMAPGRETKKLVSYMPDRMCLPGYMNSGALLGLYADFFADFDRERAEKLLAELGVDPNAKVRHMSKGTQERVQLVLAMSRRAKLYVLDEPVGGVDPATRDFIISTIMTNYAEDASVIISTHLISEVERVLDDVVFLNDGRVVMAGEADEVRSRAGKSIDELFREVFRCWGNS